tara:strand:- start:37 stop:549 length:513 start_codon:yes stop_codon:yes gene_type:complete
MPANWINEQPTNRNYLSPVGFQFDLENFPGVDFFCQAVNIPDISMSVATLPSKFRNIPIPGSGGVEYGDLTVTFLIDEDFTNYMKIQNWIRKFGLSEGHSDQADVTSAGTIQVLTSNFNGNFYVNFEDLFPVSLTGVQYDASLTNVDYLTATATFKFTRYRIQNEKGADL